jgi:hypothetical protein
VTDSADRTWFTVPELVALLGISQGRVHRLFEERVLLGSRIDGVFKVPSDFIMEGEPLGDMRGTLVVLGDSGFSDEEAMRWLLNVDDTLSVTPVSALRSGRKTEVRRVAQALGF